MESVSCNLCGAQDPKWTRDIREHSNRSVSFSIAKCKRCELVYTNPRPTEAELLVRSPAYQEMRRQMMRELLESRVGRLGIRLMKDARTPPTKTPGRVLDVGCSWGDYLGRLRALGWETHGIELDVEAANSAREVHGVEVTVGTAEEKLREYPSDSFDLVSLWHTLEHLNDPLLVLSEAYRILKPGAMLVLEVPNFDSIWSHLLRGAWFPLELPFHLYHFSPRTLRRILQKAGFAEVKVSGEPGPAQTIWSLHMVWNRLRGHCWDGWLLWSPVGTILLYPFEILSARFARSNHMRALAIKAKA